MSTNCDSNTPHPSDSAVFPLSTTTTNTPASSGSVAATTSSTSSTSPAPTNFSEVTISTNSTTTSPTMSQQQPHSQQHHHSQRDTTHVKIFCGGLPYHTTDESLRKYFEQFGAIEEAVVITDRASGKSRGYGFVTMKREEDAAKAIRDPNPCIDGRKANVNLAFLGAKPRQTPASHLQNLGNLQTVLPPANLLNSSLAQLYSLNAQFLPSSGLLASGAPALSAATPASLYPSAGLVPAGLLEYHQSLMAAMQASSPTALSQHAGHFVTAPSMSPTVLTAPTSAVSMPTTGGPLSSAAVLASLYQTNPGTATLLPVIPASSGSPESALGSSPAVPTTTATNASLLPYLIAFQRAQQQQQLQLHHQQQQQQSTQSSANIALHQAAHLANGKASSFVLNTNPAAMSLTELSTAGVPQQHQQHLTAFGQPVVSQIPSATLASMSVAYPQLHQLYQQQQFSAAGLTGGL